MSGPFTLAALGAVTLTEGIKFLYGQASELLKVRRERLKKASLNEQLEPEPRIAVPEHAPLDRRITHLTVDSRLLDEQHAELSKLAGQLAPYAHGWEDEVNPADTATVATVERLRAVLEALYGQRLTFVGEEREPSGHRVDARQIIGTLRGGVATVVETDEISHGSDVTARQDIDKVTEGGEAHVIKAKRIG